jgi:opacity protein-like surface antigen
MTCACLLAKQAGGTLRMIVRVRALLVAVGAAVMASAAAAADCASEAAVLVKEQAELPRLEIVSSADRPPYCITLETIIAFAGRVKAHVSHCPNSDYAQRVTEWDKTRVDYAKLFSQYRCRRAL